MTQTATKVFEDQNITFYTVGHASAFYPYKPVNAIQIGGSTAAADRLKLLRQCEWCKWDGVDFVSYKCPSCGNYKQQGHAVGCKLDKELSNDKAKDKT